MPSIIIIGILYILWNVYKHYRDKRKEEEEMITYDFSKMGSRKDSVSDVKENKSSMLSDNLQSATVAQETDVQLPDSFSIMTNLLTSLGCQPTTNEDKSISVKYQGENFHIECFGRYARIWDPSWAGIKADDPELSKIREAVNYTNYYFGPAVVMTSPNEEGIIGLHSRYDIMLHPACPDNKQYMQAVLDSFFETKDNVRKHFHDLNAKQMENQKKRRPVGFTSQEDDE